MQRLSLGRLTISSFAGLALAFLPQVGRAAPKPEKINFDTVDKVQLLGTFFPSSKGKKAPCALVLHNIGSSRQGVDGLARYLQEKKDIAVLTFDFRGHGDSTSVQQEFWRFNANHIKGANRNKTEISFKDFHTSYYPMLVNDIAAAKRELDKRNDAGECNAAELIVVGAQEGAALGALWLSTEWLRKKPGRNQFGAIVSGLGEPEGHDIAACIWLSMASNAGKQSMPVSYWFNQLREKETVPMCFLYGADDRASLGLAKQLFETVKRKDKTKLTFSVPLKGTKLGGEHLLGKNTLNTEELIGKYVDKVLDVRAGRAWEDRDTKKQPFVLVPLRQWKFNLP